ncbi:MAG: hypothetical protein WD669_01225 [Pirellulales bacterium]
MATDLSTLLTDSELLYQYLGKRLANGGRQEPIERLLAEFAEYRRELERARAMLREAEAQCDRGEAKPLDLEALFERADRRSGCRSHLRVDCAPRRPTTDC